MEAKDFERLNSLSQRAMNNIATPDEMIEFRQLLNTLDESIEYDIFQDLYMTNPKGSPSE